MYISHNTYMLYPFAVLIADKINTTGYKTSRDCMGMGRTWDWEWDPEPPPPLEVEVDTDADIWLAFIAREVRAAVGTVWDLRACKEDNLVGSN